MFQPSLYGSNFQHNDPYNNRYVNFWPYPPPYYGYGQSAHHQLIYHGPYHLPNKQLGKETVFKQNPLIDSQKKPNFNHYHSQHGYPFGQGSGMFPDYYNSNY